MAKLFLARVIDTFSREGEDTIQVIGLEGTQPRERVRVGKKRANPLYGESGNVPDIGELGVVAHFSELGDEYVWVCSVDEWVENIATNTNDKISHHESGVWSRLGQDGTLELSHPSGTFIKIGGTSLSARARNRKQAGTQSTRESVSYSPVQRSPKTLFISHAYATGPVTTKQCPTDKRIMDAVADSAPILTTDISLDDSGNLSITHHLASGEFTFVVDSTGKLSVLSPTGIDLLTALLNLGGASGKSLLTEDFITQALNHTHNETGGTTGTGTWVAPPTAKTTKTKAE